MGNQSMIAGYECVNCIYNKAKRFAKQLLSDVINALAFVYCFIL